MKLISEHAAIENGVIISGKAERGGPKLSIEDELRDRIEYMTYHDHLTGLSNFSSLMKHWRHIQEELQSGQIQCGVLVCDLDRFHVVNRFAGYEIGNNFIIAVSERIMSIIRKTDLLFRCSGDRFVILLPNVSKEQTKEIVERLLQQFQFPFVVNELEFVITPSIGASVYPDDGDDIETLVGNAVVAMNTVKESGKNSYRFYEIHMDTDYSPLMEQQLRKAIAQGEFTIHYQPKVNISTGMVTGVEALVRWQHPEKGLVPPAEFIPLAEASGLIVPLGSWVLKTACAQCKAWQSEGHLPLVMSVNLSPRQFKNGDIVAVVKQALDQSGLDPALLELEVTESMMLDVGFATQTLAELKELGVHTAVDDFGTGYSSLAYLKSLPLDILKVDRTFIQHCTENAQDAVLLKTIINMGQNLGLTVVAEGVENEEQLELLRDYDCPQAQGYLLSRPVPSTEIPRVIAEIRKKFLALYVGV